MFDLLWTQPDDDVAKTQILIDRWQNKCDEHDKINDIELKLLWG